jgi:site-specific recombinase XerD
MISNGYANSTFIHYEQVLNHFLRFINKRAIPWDAVFTFYTLEDFQEESGLTHASTPVRGLSRYLFQQNRISRPIEKPIQGLPEIYEGYLLYYEKTRQVHHLNILRARNTLSALNCYLEELNIGLSYIRIEHVDDFLSKHNARFTATTRQNQRSNLRGFLRYLYQDRGILRRDLGPLIIGAPLFGQAKPPKFLRPHEVKRLFASLSIPSPGSLRTSAMIYLGYTLGLRPKEISLIRLDDISFSQREITIPDRKSNNPIKLPLPEVTIKAIAVYIVGARPESNERALFLTFRAPYKPISPGSVSHDISTAMRKANLQSSAYWLRHTYAQNLLQAGASIFEIKQMMGHDKIQTTQRYLHIYTQLMREVLFDETL